MENQKIDDAPTAIGTPSADQNQSHIQDTPASDPSQAHFLWSVGSEIIETDSVSGRQAALAAARDVLISGGDAHVILVPDGQSVDELLCDKVGGGWDALQNLRRFSPTALDYCLRRLGELPHEVALEWTRDFLGEVNDPVRKKNYIARFARTLDLDFRDLPRLPIPTLMQNELQNSRHRIDVMHCMTHDAEPVDEIWAGFPAQEIGAWVGDSGIGKSYLLLEQMIGMAAGIDWLGLGTGKQAHMIYMSGEDNERAVHDRIRHIALKMNLIRKQMEDVAKYLHIEIWKGEDHDMLDQSFSWKLIDAANKSAGGTRLVAVDTYRKFQSLDENKAVDVSKVLNHFEFVINQTKSAIIYNHHASKGSSRAGERNQFASSGSGVLIANIRYNANIYAMTEDEAVEYIGNNNDRNKYFVLCTEKHSYTGPVWPKWYKRDDNGVITLDEKLTLLEKTKGNKSQGGTMSRAKQNKVEKCNAKNQKIKKEKEQM
jgi:hypothetical protein